MKITKRWPVSFTREQLQLGLVLIANSEIEFDSKTQGEMRFLFQRALDNLNERNAQEQLTQTVADKHEKDLKEKRTSAFHQLRSTLHLKKEFKKEQKQGAFE